MKVILLIGIPGSGKSTICKNWFPKYTRINQDELGDRKKCIAAMHLALQKKQDVIIDRCNMTIEQRKHWVNLALEYGAEAITCIVLDVNEEEAIARIHDRKDHPTIQSSMSLEKKREIVYSFGKTAEFPQLSEGFTSIVITRN